MQHRFCFTVVTLLILLLCSLPALANENQPITPIPLSIPIDPDKASLGEKLFFEPGLSRNGELACVSCHFLYHGGDDGLARSLTNKGKPDIIHTPTVHNAVFNFRQTWRGQFRFLEEQAEGALLNPRHFNNNWDAIIRFISAQPDYVSAFEKSYPSINRESILDALAQYEKTLITPNAPFDKYLRGDKKAITAEQQQGYQLFKEYGCISCHQGVNVGGNLFQKLGHFGDYFADRGNITKADLGRFNVTGDTEDKFVFKVPSLRNVAVTAPYFHDGRVATLEEAIRLMGRYQLGTEINNDDIHLIKSFLESLTGEYKGVPLKP